MQFSDIPNNSFLYNTSSVWYCWECRAPLKPEKVSQKSNMSTSKQGNLTESQLPIGETTFSNTAYSKFPPKLYLLKNIKFQAILT